MRKTISTFLKPNDYFLHSDMWNVDRFPLSTSKVYDIGLNESNLLNIASGIASLNNTCYIYGVCGFIIYRLEQLKFSARNFASKRGKIIICNAGKYGYQNLGDGHNLDDDIELMEILKIPYYQPKNSLELIEILNNIESKKNGIFYIQLGKDET